MRIYNDIPDLTEKTAIALGFFDGLHIAHQEVIKAVTNQKSLTKTVLTFRINISAPKAKQNIKTILTENQKLAELERLGVEAVISPSFDDIDGIDAITFFEEILVKKLNAEFISCGYDYRFGHDALGNVKLLAELCQKHGITLSVTQKLEQNGKAISSTELRERLSDGDIKTANKLLGYAYYMQSVVEHGKKIGSKIGYPTINQAISPEQIVLRHGVYKTKTLIGSKEYKSITNVGINPTIKGERLPLAETYLLDFNDNIYGETIKVIFEDFIRDEKKFSSIEELKVQIASDIAGSLK